MEEMKERMKSGDPGADITQVLNADRRYRYRGINKKPERIARAQAKGFEHVPEDDPARWPIDMGRNGKEMGDLTLMREPLEVYHLKNNKNKEKGRRATRQKIEETKEVLNKFARETGAVGAHKESAFETSPSQKEEEE